VYVADYSNHAIRKIEGGIMITVAGTRGTLGTTDNVAATSARLNNPFGIWINTLGDMFIADYNNHAIRMVSASTGNMTTLAGAIGTQGVTDDTVTAATSGENKEQQQNTQRNKSNTQYFLTYKNNRYKCRKYFTFETTFYVNILKWLFPTTETDSYFIFLRYMSFGVYEWIFAL
jgi:hypothetical protein